MKEKAIKYYKKVTNPHWKKFDNKAAAEYMPKGKGLLAELLQGKAFKSALEQRIESARNSARG